MSTTSNTHLVSHPLIDRLSERQRSLILVATGTILGAIGQIFMKKGVDPTITGMVATAIHIFTNLNMFLGYSLYGISAALLVLALRKGHLSMLYPVIALTSVWVAVLSVIFFNETLTPLRLGGIATVVVGVGLLGMGSHPEPEPVPVKVSTEEQR